MDTKVDKKRTEPSLYSKRETPKHKDLQGTFVKLRVALPICDTTNTHNAQSYQNVVLQLHALNKFKLQYKILIAKAMLLYHFRSKSA